MPLYSGGGGDAAPYGPITPPKPAPGQGSYYPVGAAPNPTDWSPAPVSTGGGGDSGGGGGDSGGGGNGGGTGGGGGYSFTVPPIDQILGGDANYQQLLSFDTAASGDDLATMNAHIARMQGYYGNDNDPLSILGRVYQAYQDRNRYISNTLAGHGMIDSGETGFQAGRATLDYQRAELDARQKLQDYIDGLQEAFKAAERQRKFNEMQASWQAVQNYITTNQPIPNPTTGGTG